MVGGFVRDVILEYDNDDYDICTNMPLEDLATYFDEFKMMIENDRRQVVMLFIS